MIVLLPIYARTSQQKITPKSNKKPIYHPSRIRSFSISSFCQPSNRTRMIDPPGSEIPSQTLSFALSRRCINPFAAITVKGRLIIDHRGIVKYLGAAYGNRRGGGQNRILRLHPRHALTTTQRPACGLLAFNGNAVYVG